LILPIKGWDVIFFYFLGGKSPTTMAKVPAAKLNPAAVRLHCNWQNVMRRRVKLDNHGVFLGLITGNVWKSGSSKRSFKNSGNQ